MTSTFPLSLSPMMRSPRRTVSTSLVWPALGAALLVGIGRTPVAAQSAGHEPAVVELPASARAMGLGGAFQLGAPDSDIVFHHPALSERAAGMMLGYQRYGGAATGMTLSAGAGWLDGGVAVGLQALEYGSAGPGLREGGLDPILAGGEKGAGELVATLAYARPVGPVRLGVAGKLVGQRIGEARDTRGAIDVGVAREVGSLWLALSARNLGPAYALDGVEAPQPEEIRLGAGGYGRPVGPLDVGLAATVARRADGEWTGGGGVELGYWPVRGRTFVVRVGGRRVPEGGASPVTFGGSFWGDDLVVEYAFEPVDGRDGVHRVALGWR